MVINKNHLQDKSRGLGSSPEVSMLLLLVFFFFSVYIWSNIYLKSMHATAFKVGKWLVCHFGVVVVVRLISFPCPLFLLSSLIVVKHCKHPFPINWPYGRLHGNQIFTFFLALRMVSRWCQWQLWSCISAGVMGGRQTGGQSRTGGLASATYGRYQSFLWKAQ